MKRRRRMDQALRVENPWMWFATFAVLLLGIALIVLAIVPGDRHRAGVMERVRLGDPADHASEVLGLEPLRCPAGDLGHLRSSFPEGWPPAAVDVALEELRRATAERRVYGADGAAALCAPTPGQTEIGVDEDDVIVWTVPVLGRSALRLPPGLSPSGVEPAIDEAPF